MTETVPPQRPRKLKFALLASALLIVVAGMLWLIAHAPRQSRAAENPGSRLADDKIEALLAEHLKPGAGPRVFLVELPEYEMSGVWFPNSTGKTGRPTLGAPPDAFKIFGILGKTSEHAIGMHPGATAPAHVAFSLGKKFKTFSTVVSQNDNLPRAGTDMTFRILGDGKLLWASNPISYQAETQRCEISVEGVDVLQLEVGTSGPPRACHAIWFEPFLRP